MTIAIQQKGINEGTTWASEVPSGPFGNSNMKCVALRNTKFFKPSLSISEMGRPSYVCTTCSEHFTRRYSGERHNNNLHNGAAEIVRLIDYLAGRSSGQYLTNSPFRFERNNHNIRSPTVADTVGNGFQPGYILQQGYIPQTPLGTSKYSPGPIYPP
jgi:transposase-like protein